MLRSAVGVRTVAALNPLAWAAGLLALAQVPTVVALLPIMAVFRAPFGLAMLGFATLIAAAHATRLSDRLIHAVTTSSSMKLFILSATVFALVGLHYSGGIQATGDEPEYLLMSQSLWMEGDLDLRDNWNRGDFREYISALPRFPYGALRRDGTPISTHSPGLSVLLAPIYGLGGRPACVLFLALAGAALCLQVRALALHWTTDPEAVAVAWASSMGPPVIFYSFHMYTEILSALGLAASLRLLLTASGPAMAVLAALLASALPWLHVKMIPAACALGLIAVWSLRGRARVMFLVVAGLMVVGYLAYFNEVFGMRSPLALYGGAVPTGVKDALPNEAVGGLFLDRSFGLLPYAPVFLLALAGFPLIFMRRWRESLPVLLVSLAVLAPLIGWRAWFAGHCPPARFLVPLVPILCICAALRVAVDPERRGIARWRWVLVALGLVIAALCVYDPQSLFLLNKKQAPPRLWSFLMGETFVLQYLPSFVFRFGANPRVAIVWTGVLFLLLLLDRVALRYRRVDRLFRGPGLAIALFLLGGLLVEHWAGPAFPNRSYYFRGSRQTILPATIVATAAPLSIQPPKGVFRPLLSN